MAHQFTTSYLADALVLRTYKRREAAMEQAADEELNRVLDPESNSIATIVKHMAGNMRSRWTDFLTSDGEKPDRRRDTEFEAPPATRAELTALWEAGWKCVFDRAFLDADRAHRHDSRRAASVMRAINRQMAHYAAHVGRSCFSQSISVGRGGRSASPGQIRRGIGSARRMESCPTLRTPRADLSIHRLAVRRRGRSRSGTGFRR
jgi:hypothetical protein